MKPLFGDKGGAKDDIVLVKDQEIISAEGEVAQIFIDLFSNFI